MYPVIFFVIFMFTPYIYLSHLPYTLYRVLEIDPNDQTAYHMLFEEIKREIPQNPSHSGAGGDEDHM